MAVSINFNIIVINSDNTYVGLSPSTTQWPGLSIVKYFILINSTTTLLEFHYKLIWVQVFAHKWNIEGNYYDYNMVNPLNPPMHSLRTLLLWPISLLRNGWGSIALGHASSLRRQRLALADDSLAPHINWPASPVLLPFWISGSVQGYS